MAGIFEPQTIQGSSLRGESFIRQPTEVISGQAIQGLAKAGTDIYGGIQVNKARTEVAAEQADFIGKISATRADIQQAESLQAEQSTLDQADPDEQAAFNAANSQIQTLRDAVAARKIDPVAAMTRVDNIKKKYINRAPFFADKIRGLAGGSSATAFDSETKQLIKETTAIRDGVLARGGNPDSPRQTEEYLQGLQLEAQAKQLASQGALEGRKALQIAGGVVSSAIAFQKSIVDDAVGSFGGNFQNIPDDVRAQVVLGLGRATNGGEKLIVQQIISNTEGLDYSLIPKEEVERLEAMVKASADHMIAQYDQKVPKALAVDTVALLENNATRRFANIDPDGFAMWVVAKQSPQGSLAASTLSNLGTDALLESYRKIVEGRRDKTAEPPTLSWIQKITGSKSEANKVQSEMGSALTKSRKFVSDNPDTVSQGFIGTSADSLSNAAEMIADDPAEYSPQMFNAVIDGVNDPKYIKMVKEMGEDFFPIYQEKTVRAIKNYTKENLAVDVQKSLSEEVFSTVADGMTAGDLITATVSPVTGQLVFVPNTGFSNEKDAQTAARLAKKFTDRYAKSSVGAVQALKTLSGIGDDRTAEVATQLFQRALRGTTEPLRAGADKIVEKPYTRSQALRELNQLVSAGIPGIDTTGIINPFNQLTDQILADESVGSARLREFLQSMLDQRASDIAEFTGG